MARQGLAKLGNAGQNFLENFGLMHPIFKIWPKNFEKNFQSFGAYAPNFQNVTNNF
jgi:hypothetical protein